MISRVQNTEGSYFLWVLLMDTHTPYFTPRSHRTENSWWEMMHSTLKLRTSDFESALPDEVHENLVSAYDDSIRYVDTFFDRLQDDLAESDPIYIVHSDHGEGFFEHESYYHRKYVYSENVRVPLLITNCDVDRQIETPISLQRLPGIVESTAIDDVSGLLDLVRDENKSRVTACSREGTEYHPEYIIRR